MNNSQLQQPMYIQDYRNMNLIHKNSHNNELWLGDLGAATNLKLLTQKNIKYVYTAAALDVSYKKQQNIIHKKIQAFDMPNYDLSQHFGSAYSFIHDSLQKGNVLVHCAAGVSRSATIVIMYLMKLNNWQLSNTINFVRSKRQVIYPNPGFIYQLRQFENLIRTKIQLQNEQKAVIKFINEQNMRKTHHSVFSKTTQPAKKQFGTYKKTQKQFQNHSVKKDKFNKTTTSFRGYQMNIREPKVTTHTKKLF